MSRHDADRLARAQTTLTTAAVLSLSATLEELKAMRADVLEAATGIQSTDDTDPAYFTAAARLDEQLEVLDRRIARLKAEPTEPTEPPPGAPPGLPPPLVYTAPKTTGRRDVDSSDYQGVAVTLIPPDETDDYSPTGLWRWHVHTSLDYEAAGFEVSEERARAVAELTLRLFDLLNGPIKNNWGRFAADCEPKPCRPLPMLVPSE